ncbi:hypothetical protein CIHG_09914 [Coccidioides immitis H538.4]|uniref:Uncharacterized protein n=3 Tax=Coccidioides immitis TaxID=5501 RepID=A0A0J8QQK2_COCIT|nr:hypothetical protein CIRG_01512 [Coccidioides immitis RMSCC 2394]KMU73573.1 hypothetical protein CISG_10113 [Coccidioides immitis RMSCC 3703]KMU92076.1 hypothetical protein CIHG_09914 [Coccidioides immitis H538.4]
MPANIGTTEKPICALGALAGGDTQSSSLGQSLSFPTLGMATSPGWLRPAILPLNESEIILRHSIRAKNKASGGLSFTKRESCFKAEEWLVTGYGRTGLEISASSPENVIHSIPVSKANRPSCILSQEASGTLVRELRSLNILPFERPDQHSTVWDSGCKVLHTEQRSITPQKSNRRWDPIRRESSQKRTQALNLRSSLWQGTRTGGESRSSLPPPPESPKPQLS